MQEHRHAVTTSLVILALLVVALSVKPSRAFDTPPLYTTAPTPEELAQRLYGPRYRSAISQPNGKRFAMLINFELNSTKMLSHSRPLLDSVGKMLALRESTKEVLVIEGHADARGTHEYNMNLSEQRAKAIKSYLVKHFDIAPERLVTRGKGETELRNPTKGEDPINRRAEFKAVRSIVIN